MAAEPVVLLVTDSEVLPGSAVVWAVQKFEDKAAAGKAVGVSTHADGRLKQGSGTAEVLISLAAAPAVHSLDRLKELSRVLKPGGTLVVQENVNEESRSSLQRNMFLAGLVGVESLEAVEDLALASGLSSVERVLFRAQKPDWEVGSSFPLKRKTGAPQETPVSGSVLKLPVLAFDDDFDLVDEDSLLTEEDLKRPELPAADDCEVGNAGRKACKNCTCGRAELEEKEETITDEMLNNPKSACGSCGLGDAFRCGTCPYKGLPPFKIGEKITLSGTLLTADV